MLCLSCVWTPFSFSDKEGLFGVRTVANGGGKIVFLLMGLLVALKNVDKWL